LNEPLPQASDALFEQLDKNGDSALSQNEIKKGLATVKETTGLVQSAKQIFRGADADGDRSVDADEFYSYMAENMKATTETEVQSEQKASQSL
jgi:Ca2+-binding EF-hand superfamily protein